MRASVRVSPCSCSAVSGAAARTYAMYRPRRAAASSDSSSTARSRLRPRRWPTSSRSNDAVTGLTSPASTASSSPVRRSGGALGSASRTTSRGCASRIRLNRNSSSSTSSRDCSFSATASAACRASASTPSIRSAGRDQRPAISQCSASRVALPTLPDSTRSTSPVRASGGVEGSDRWRRSTGSRPSSAATANSSPDSVSRSAGRAPSTYRSRRARAPARVSRLAAFICPAPRPLGTCTPRKRSAGSASARGPRCSGPAAPRCSAAWSGLPALGRPVAGRGGAVGGHPVQLGEEPVHRPPAPGLVLDRLPDDPASQRHRQVADLRAQLPDHLLTLGGELLRAALPDALRLLLGLGAQLLAQPVGVGAGRVADLGGLGPGLGERALVLGVGLLQLLAGLPALLDLAPDQLLALPHRLLHRRHDVPVEHVQDDQERDDLGDERRVGHQEVALGQNGVWLGAHVLFARTKTNSAMKARLMKYMASTRPTVRKKMVNSRPWASGWRATPEIVALPARPSPTAAPMAPPPRARPPPTNAPASWIACSVVAISLLLFLSRSTAGWKEARRSRSGVSSSVPSLFLGRRRPEVQDRQQGEDERLDEPDEQVEQLPRDVRAPQDVRREERDQRDHDHAGEDVAEQPQGQGDRLGDLLDQVDREQPPVRLRQVAVVAPEALLADAGHVHADDHQQRKRVRQVDVRGGWRQVLRGVPAGDQRQPVGRQDEAEQGHRQRHHERRGAQPHGGLDLALHRLDDRLEEELRAARHARRQPPAHVQAEADHQQAGHRGRIEGVQVEEVAADLAGDVLADLDLGNRLWLTHEDRNSLSSGTDAPPIMISWKMARPAMTPSPSGRTANAHPPATAVTTASRPSTDMVNRRFLLAASLVAYRTTERCTSTVFSAPRASPSSAKSPIATCPVRASTTRLMPPRQAAMTIDLRRVLAALVGTVSTGCTG